MKQGDKVRVIGPLNWLEQIGIHNRINQVATLVQTDPVDWGMCEGRGATNIFRIKFDDSQPDMFHHCWGACLEEAKQQG